MTTQIQISEIRKRDGRIAKFEQEKITNAIHKAILAVKSEDGILAKQLSDQVVSTIEEKFKGKIPGVEDVQDIVEEVLIRNGLANVAKAYILYRQKRTELREAKKFIGVYDELKLPLNATSVLERRYLLKDEKGNLIETPAQMFRRVAKAIAIPDLIYDKNADVKKTEEEFYQLMANLEFLPNSPTLFNAGTELAQLAACFVLDVSDSLPSIFEAVKNAALIFQSGGGVGYSFSKLRPKGDMVKSTKSVASGPCSFMRVFDVATDVIKSGGKRRGANMGILRVDHPDIIEFITAKEKEGQLANFNISVAVTDKFMEAVEKDEQYDLINPRTGKSVKKLRARDVFDLIVTMAWRTGDPGIVFIDEINRHNPTPTLGAIESTNPCVTRDTFVTTDEGLVRIDNLHNPQRVLARDGAFHSIAWVGRTGFKEVYKIKTKAGYEVKATPDHRFLTANGIWKPARELTGNDRLVLQADGKFGTFHVDRELALALGWLIGDGCLTRNLEDVILNFNTGEKLEIMPVLKRYLDKLNKREIKSQFYGNEVRLKYSSKIAKLFYDLGVEPTETCKKAVPSSVFTMDRESVRNFLSALFSADSSPQGNRRKGVSIRLVSVSLKLLKQVQLLLLQFGIYSRIYENRRNARWKFLPDSKGGMKKYHCHAEHELVITRESMFKFIKEIGFCLSSKTLKFERIKPQRIFKENPNLQVETVEPIGVDEVYDLNEPTTNSFSANGIITHNCGEVPLLPYESCNLGSINLSKMVNEEKKEIDWEKLRRTVYTTVHFLDNVIDANKYPLPEIEKMTKANRKIGLGIMGFADALLKLGIRYDSEEALSIAEKLMKFISDEARKKSVKLALERSPFPNFEVSIWKEKGYKAMRNATLTAVAPTGTISIIAGCSSGIEPNFAISFIRNVMGTQLLEVNQYFEKIMKERGLYSTELMMKIARKGSIQNMKEISEDIREIFVTSLDISPEWHVRMQAAFQKYVDNAVAKTVNLPHEATLEDVRKIFWLAYKLKCKGVTIYRYGSKKEQVLYIGPTVSKTEGGREQVTAESEYAGECPTGVCPF
ncbi:MAG: ATP cone domain-containing protein [Euryarchaeota archaeon]|nr:ATP cone domain-containing protein [Euryarchaeota archaeon]